jgi:putative NADH-flavin reductase
MHVTIFGASGNVGRLAVEISLAEGYTVTAFIHRHNPFDEQKGLNIVSGNITDPEAVTKALQGSDGVISALGSWHTKEKNTLSSAMKTIIPAMEQIGISRIVTLTGAGAFWEKDKLTAFDTFNHALAKLAASKILGDAEEHLRLLQASSLEWTCVRSPVMTRSSKEGYRLSLKLSPPWISIPRRAVAQCLVDRLSQTDFIQAAPELYRL